KMPLVETMIPNPISPYGLQKLAGEQWAKMFTELYQLPVVCLRYFNVYGPRIDFNSDYSLVLGKFLKQHSQQETFTIFGDGEQTRAFCFVSDVVTANIRAIESPKVKGGEVINIGAQTSQSINYLADLVGGEKTYLPQRAGDMLHTQADTQKAKELLDWEPKVSLEEGVEITKKWFEGKN
ncbi:MAG: NAD-dependent epimerase/dehydratase family protein, partial [Candidatus Gribaldobacteria bacterium]|nr:NAD-dependent epimerase/dehydratase family protein [Candidatus Gribaldobacteria bacterium]